MTPQALATGLGREGYKFFPNHFLGSLGHRSSPSIRSSHGTREREREIRVHVDLQKRFAHAEALSSDIKKINK